MVVSHILTDERSICVLGWRFFESWAARQCHQERIAVSECHVVLRTFHNNPIWLIVISVQLSVADLFIAPSIEKMAQKISKQKALGSVSPSPALFARDRFSTPTVSPEIYGALSVIIISEIIRCEFC